MAATLFAPPCSHYPQFFFARSRSSFSNDTRTRFMKTEVPYSRLQKPVYIPVIFHKCSLSSFRCTYLVNCVIIPVSLNSQVLPSMSIGRQSFQIHWTEECIWISVWLLLSPADKMSVVISCVCTGQRWTPWGGYGDRVTLCLGCMGFEIPRCWWLKAYYRTTYRASVEYVCENHSAPSRNKEILLNLLLLQLMHNIYIH